MYSSCNKGSNNDDDSCNGESTRRAVKICIDAEADLINLNPIDINVKEFGELNAEEVDKEDERQPLEKNVYRITAVVHKLSHHRDGDWKVKLTDGDDRFVNCENPNPNCEYAMNSIFHNNYLVVRDWINENKDDLEGKTVTITGIGFIDIDHKYPRNAAENEMELHPILTISF